MGTRHILDEPSLAEGRLDLFAGGVVVPERDRRQLAAIPLQGLGCHEAVRQVDYGRPVPAGSGHAAGEQVLLLVPYFLTAVS